LIDAGAKPMDIIEGALASAHLAAALCVSDDNSVGRSSENDSVSDRRAATAAAAAFAEARVDAFARALEEKKWRTDFVQMGTAPRYRLRGRVAVDADADDVAAVNEIELLVE
jgi:hypothetical protein